MFAEYMVKTTWIGAGKLVTWLCKSCSTAYDADHLVRHAIYRSAKCRHCGNETRFYVPDGRNIPTGVTDNRRKCDR